MPIRPDHAGHDVPRVHRLKRAGLAAGAWLFVTFFVCIPVGILGSSNLVWGEPNQYGSIPIPGAKTMHLPAGDVDVAVAMVVSDRGNETPTLPIPDDLAITTPREIRIVDDIRLTQNAMSDDVDTQRHVFKLVVPKAGDYRIAIRGQFYGVGVNPTLWLGHSPPLPPALIPVIAGVIALIGLGAWNLRRSRLRSNSS